MYIKRKNLSFFNITFYTTIIYLLMRPFINEYLTEYVKIVLILGFAYCMVLALSRKKVLGEIGRVEILLFFAVWLYVTISSLFNGGSELFLYTLERYMFYSMPLFIIPVIRTNIDWNGVLNFLSVFGIIDSSISIIEFVTRKQMFVIGTRQVVEQQWGDNSLRTYGLSGNYFLLAEILCLCGLAALYQYISKKKKRYLVTFLIISVGILTTGSRGYYVSYFVGVCMMLFLNVKRRGMRRATVIKGILIIILVAIACVFIFATNYLTGVSFIDTILSRCRSIINFSDNKANVTRYAIWMRSLQRWLEHFWFGSGAQCTDARYSQYIGVTESGVLKRLVELGFIGTILQYSTMIVPITSGIKKFNKSPVEFQPFIFFISLITSLLVEDIVLQQYTSMEYTIFIWTAMSFILTANKREELGQW